MAIGAAETGIVLGFYYIIQIASYISSSVSSSAPASIIITFCFVEDTVSAIRLFARCSAVGLITYFPSIIPTETEPVGPEKGISEIERAIEEYQED